MFSFNSPFGACPTCDGLGQKLKVDLDLVIPDKNKTLNEGAIEPWEPTSSDFYPTLLKRVCEVYKINMDKPYKKLTDRQKNILMNGSGEKKLNLLSRNEMVVLVNVKWFLKVWYLTLTVVTMNPPLNIHAK